VVRDFFFFFFIGGEGGGARFKGPGTVYIPVLPFSRLAEGYCIYTKRRQGIRVLRKSFGGLGLNLLDGDNSIFSTLKFLLRIPIKNLSLNRIIDSLFQFSYPKLNQNKFPRGIGWIKKPEMVQRSKDDYIGLVE